MATNVREILPHPQAAPARDGKFFKVQIRGWLDFDPTGRELSEIVQAIETGSGFVSVVEVTQIANALEDINDPEVRERFSDIVAVNRILQKVNEIPHSLRDKLHRALTNERPRGANPTSTGLAS